MCGIIGYAGKEKNAIQYKFDNPVLAKKCKCIFSNSMPSSIKSFEISASNDGSNFDTLYDKIFRVYY